MSTSTLWPFIGTPSGKGDLVYLHHMGPHRDPMHQVKGTLSTSTLWPSLGTLQLKGTLYSVQCTSAVWPLQGPLQVNGTLYIPPPCVPFLTPFMGASLDKEDPVTSTLWLFIGIPFR
jgi:hypothetical protein